MLGDLPQEWGEYLPPPQANGTQSSTSVLLSLLKQACYIAINLDLSSLRPCARRALTNPDFLEDLEIGRYSLAEWLHETYFDDGKQAYFTEAEIKSLSDLLQSMMQYRPSNRPQAAQLLSHSWFQNSHRHSDLR